MVESRAAHARAFTCGHAGVGCGRTARVAPTPQPWQVQAVLLTHEMNGGARAEAVVSLAYVVTLIKLARPVLR